MSTRPGADVAAASTPVLPPRRGPRPRTTSHIPHAQLAQQPADPAITELLVQKIFGLPGVNRGPSGVSVPGASAAIIDDAVATAGEFLVGREFAHLHPAPDHSLHVALPAPLADHVIELGWAERHMLAGTDGVPIGTVMIYAPRDAEESAIVAAIVESGYLSLVTRTRGHGSA